MPFFRVDTMMVCADTKHGAVQRLTGIYSVYGLTRAYVTQSGRGQTGFWLSLSSRIQSSSAQRQTTFCIHAQEVICHFQSTCLHRKNQYSGRQNVGILFFRYSNYLLNFFLSSRLART